MPIFTNSAAIWGTIIFLGLLAVYAYRRRSRRVVVSSLMFFAKSKSTAEGGQKLSKLQTPLLFFIEFLILLLLILAIADPINLQKGRLIPVTIVLDDSISMTAGGRISSRSRAVSYFEQKVFSHELYRITMIRAGAVPQIMGRRDMTGVEAENCLKDWTCESAISDLSNAMLQAFQISDANAVLVVVTDHAKPKNTDGRIKWLSFGRALDNMAITAANRTRAGKTDKCFFEFTNFSNVARELDAEIIDTASNEVLETLKEKLGAGNSRRIVAITHNPAATVKAVIKNDDVTFDNEATLLPIIREKINVTVRISSDILKKAVEKAVMASDMANLVTSEPDLLIVDSEQGYVGDSVDTLFVFHSISQPYRLQGDVAFDSSHPITENLTFDNALWAVDKDYKENGRRLISSGDLPLMVLKQPSELKNHNTVFFNYSADFSELHKTTMWPVMFYSLIDWCQKKQNGPSTFNFRSGNSIELQTKAGTDVYMTAMSGQIDNVKSTKQKAHSYNGLITFKAGIPGIFKIGDDKTSYMVSVNLCSPEESDLTNAEGMDELPEIICDDSMSHFASVKWWFIIAAFVLLAVHEWLISRRRSGYAY